jgi:uncharacterized NAD(P)/FAD-binding protein YdhS
MWRKCQLKKKILVESRPCYMEVKVPEGGAGVSGEWTLDVLHAKDRERQQISISQMLARRCSHGHPYSHELRKRLIMLHVGEIGGFLPPCTSHFQGWT